MNNSAEVEIASRLILGGDRDACHVDRHFREVGAAHKGVLALRVSQVGWLRGRAIERAASPFCGLELMLSGVIIFKQFGERIVPGPETSSSSTETPRIATRPPRELWSASDSSIAPGGFGFCRPTGA